MVVRVVSYSDGSACSLNFPQVSKERVPTLSYHCAQMWSRRISLIAVSSQTSKMKSDYITHVIEEDQGKPLIKRHLSKDLKEMSAHSLKLFGKTPFWQIQSPRDRRELGTFKKQQGGHCEHSKIL